MAEPAASPARELQIGRVPVNLTANLNANLNATGYLGLVIPSYVFATPVLGGQAAVSVMGIYGRTSTSLAGTLTAVYPVMAGLAFIDPIGMVGLFAFLGAIATAEH